MSNSSVIINAPSAGKFASQRPQLVASNPKIHRASVVPVNPGITASILRLTFQSQLRLRSFRQVAQLAGVPERVVFQVVRENAHMPKAA